MQRQTAGKRSGGTYISRLARELTMALVFFSRNVGSTFVTCPCITERLVGRVTHHLTVMSLPSLANYRHFRPWRLDRLLATLA
jgi:hypothetical protein